MTQERSQPILIVLLLIGLLILSFFILQPYLTAIILAAVFAIIFWPLYRKLAAWMRIPGFSALIMVLIVLVVFLMPLTFLGAKVFNEAYNAYVSLTGTGGNIPVDSVVQWLQKKVADVIPFNIAPLTVSQYAKSILEWFVANVGTIFASVARGLFTFVLSLFALFYFFRDGSKIKEFIIGHSPLHEPYNSRLFEKTKTAVNSVIRGTLIVSLLQGIASGIGFLIFGVPNPALWGGLAMIAALVPTLGTSLVLVPTIAYLLFSGEIMMAIGLLIWGLLAVGLIDNTLGPKMIGKGMKIHPLVTFLGVLGGVSLFGPIGFVLGPIIFALLYAVSDIYFELVKKSAEGV
jgi:predicted PurR-regulated permease PerM